MHQKIQNDILRVLDARYLPSFPDETMIPAGAAVNEKINDQMRSIWPDWQIEDKIGEGSFGIVYRVSRTEFSQTFYSAVKVITIPNNEAEMKSLRLEGLNEGSMRKYYRDIVEACVNEISALERLKGSAHIVNIEDFKVIQYPDMIRWDIFIRMELLEGLDAYLSRKGKLSQIEVIKLGEDICDALSVCEMEHIIHRDIKQENVFVTKRGDFKLGDFGIAKTLEKTGSVYSQKGTYSYMAPEVYRGNSYGASVDIYALGILMYRLLNNNRIPFLDPDKQFIRYDEREAALKRRMDGEQLPLLSGVNPDLSEIILQACRYEPEKRFRSAEAMRNAPHYVMVKMQSQEDGIIQIDLEQRREKEYQQEPKRMQEQEPRRRQEQKHQKEQEGEQEQIRYPEQQKQKQAVKRDSSQRGNKYAIASLITVIIGFFLYYNISGVFLAAAGIVMTFIAGAKGNRSPLRIVSCVVAVSIIVLFFLSRQMY